jgi:hypothetical protein
VPPVHYPKNRISAVKITALIQRRVANIASRGKPPSGRSSDRPVTVYLSPEDITALDRLADLRTVRTGKNTSRTDLVREAVRMLLAREQG